MLVKEASDYRHENVNQDNFRKPPGGMLRPPRKRIRCLGLDGPPFFE
jgi:hypothetical protein